MTDLDISTRHIQYKRDWRGGDGSDVDYWRAYCGGRTYDGPTSAHRVLRANDRVPHRAAASRRAVRGLCRVMLAFA